MNSEVSEMEGTDGFCGGGAEGSRCSTFALSELPQDCIASVISLLPLEMPVAFRLFRLPLNRRLNPTPSGRASCRRNTRIRFPHRSVALPRSNFILAFVKILSSSMGAERDLFIVWGDTPTYWRWISVPESRFEEVAELIDVCWFEIRGKIAISMLSPMTHYQAYLVFKLTTGAFGFDSHPAEVNFGLVGTEGCKRTVHLDAYRGLSQRYHMVPRRIGLFSRPRFFGLRTPGPTIAAASDDDQRPKARGDGWLEIKLGELFNDGCTDGELEMSVLEVNCGNWKSGLIVQGIEIRPNLCN
ncbi:putative receptor serine-threonine protein kinase [Hibiscus syriacus]|uniref:Receptor serine-threonine protein kinase n=1 Tax=Hibiscus syriacus TaxID=106335 RepID=A0A6A2Z8N6_HIBSY|nr:putative receptor serine-threonine protein kinase [Hibiscus syriacus]